MKQWQPSLADPNVRVDGIAELEQAMRIVLASPVGSVPGRPTFGSRLFELIDAPLNTVRARAPAEVQRALAVEPRIELVETTVESVSADGGFVLQLMWRPSGVPDAEVRSSAVAVGR